jgi:hypothetical protein
LRSFSVICGIITIPVMYALGRELFGSATGVAAALLTAVLPFHIYYAQEVRPYGLVILLSALTLWTFARSWKGTGYRTWIGFGLLAGLSLYTHAPGGARRWLLVLLALVLPLIFLVLSLSWTIGAIYLDRSFSSVTPAYVLLLGWGLTHPPRSSPLPLFYGGLAIVVAISLGNHYLQPDPAKPPFREVGKVLRSNWQENDVLLNLHDSSYLPLRYCAPELESYLLNNDPDGWLPPYTWEWAGQQVSSLDEIVDGKSRL